MRQLTYVVGKLQNFDCFYENELHMLVYPYNQHSSDNIYETTYLCSRKATGF